MSGGPCVLELPVQPAEPNFKAILQALAPFSFVSSVEWTHPRPGMPYGHLWILIAAEYLDRSRELVCAVREATGMFAPWAISVLVRDRTVWSRSEAPFSSPATDAESLPSALASAMLAPCEAMHDVARRMSEEAYIADLPRHRHGWERVRVRLAVAVAELRAYVEHDKNPALRTYTIREVTRMVGAAVGKFSSMLWRANRKGR